MTKAEVLLRRQVADYAMAYDLMARLAAVMSEMEAIDNILDLCTTLFAPGSLTYLSIVQGKVERVHSWPPPPADGDRVDTDGAGHPSIGTAVESRPEESPRGFVLPIGHQGETLGVVRVDGIAYPEYRQHYLNLGLALASVCGLAIANARTYEKMKKTEEALAAERERLRVTLHSIGDGVIATDTGGRVVMVNRVAEQLTGWSQDEARGLPLADIFPIINEQTRETVENPVARTLATGQIVGLANHTALVARDGTERSIADSAAPIRDEAGVVLGVVLVFRDVSAAKWAELERERMRSEVKELVAEAYQRAVDLDAVNKELETFAYSVSHDLRAPLRHIEGFARVLLEDYPDRLDEQGKRYLGFVGDAAQRMSQLIDALLALSRVTSFEMHRQQVDLSAVARSVADALRESQPERQVELSCAEGLVVTGDGRLLRIVLENLLGNAWKFTAHRPVARVDVGVLPADGEEDGKPVYFVRDNGAGFDMAYADKLFGAFRRLHSESEFPGSGIGLATVQRIVRRHGGRVWAEAEIDKGATFYFMLG
ncbi:MAG: PAS domain S-box protein [Chloroflexi bacterium]|nr:PAS domain S-box protein [Chloroflexota bacterium]